MKHLKRLGMGFATMGIAVLSTGAVLGVVKLLIMFPVVTGILLVLFLLYALGLLIEVVSY